jgi:hypothetical protein
MEGMRRSGLALFFSLLVLAPAARTQDAPVEPVPVTNLTVLNSSWGPRGGGLMTQADDVPLAWLRADDARIEVVTEASARARPDERPTVMVLFDGGTVTVEIEQVKFHPAPPRLSARVSFSFMRTAADADRPLPDFDPRPLVQLFALAPGAPRHELERVVARTRETASAPRGEPFDVTGPIAPGHELTFWWTLARPDVDAFLLVRNAGRLPWPLIRVPLPR